MPLWLLLLQLCVSLASIPVMLWLDSWLTKRDRERRGWASAKRQALEFEVHHRDHKEGGWN